MGWDVRGEWWGLGDGGRKECREREVPVRLPIDFCGGSRIQVGWLLNCFLFCGGLIWFDLVFACGVELGGGEFFCGCDGVDALGAG